MAGTDLVGCEAIVTDGYSSIGYEPAPASAGAGGLVIAGRDRQRGDAAARELMASTSWKVRFDAALRRISVVASRQAGINDE